MDLMTKLALTELQVRLMHAELFHQPAKNQSIQAKVELTLKPQLIAGDAVHNQFSLACLAQVQGQLVANEGSLDVFRIELRLMANYQQFSGEPLSAELFGEYHSSVARQLYPVVHLRLTELLQQLGLSNVQLPLDLMHLNAEPESPHVQSQAVH